MYSVCCYPSTLAHIRSPRPTFLSFAVHCHSFVLCSHSSFLLRCSLTELPVPVNAGGIVSITERAPAQQHDVNSDSKQADETEAGKKAELLDDDVTQEMKQGRSPVEAIHTHTSAQGQ